MLTAAYLALLSRLVFNTPLFFFSFIDKMALQYGCTVSVVVLYSVHRDIDAFVNCTVSDISVLQWIIG